MRYLLALLAALLAPAAGAQTFPSKPLTMVVGFEPGGGTDTVARVVAKFMAENVGQQVVVENRAGAGGNTGAFAVATSAPDGYTLLMSSAGILTANPHLYAKMPFDAASARAWMKECYDSADYKEGRTAFMEKRKPVFTGK